MYIHLRHIRDKIEKQLKKLQEIEFSASTKLTTTATFIHGNVIFFPLF